VGPYFYDEVYAFVCLVLVVVVVVVVSLLTGILVFYSKSVIVTVTGLQSQNTRVVY